MSSDTINIENYLKLIHQFPLRPIRSDAELDKAIQVIDSLLDRDEIDPAEADYLEVVSDLVERYETEKHPIPPVSDVEVLEHLMEAREVTQSEVAQETGIAGSTISEILSGRRALNRTHIDKLSRYFHVDPGVFLQVCGSHTEVRKRSDIAKEITSGKVQRKPSITG